MKHNKLIFVDCTFYITLKFSYQAFITRSLIKDLNNFYTTFFYSLLKNKEQTP